MTLVITKEKKTFGFLAFFRYFCNNIFVRTVCKTGFSAYFYSSYRVCL